jgi:AraC-like DNA-binding protein
MALKVGESQLRRRIQALTGKNAVAYVTQLRMEKAMRLLIECPDCLIGDIAEQCGFQDVAYFSRVFRQYYGMTPTQARNQ